MKYYLAGPMRGIPQYNYPLFAEMAKALRELGHDVISPAELDHDAAGFDPAALPADFDWNTIPAGFDFRACMARDLAAVAQCEGIFLLEGWEKSSGARAEKALAECLGLSIAYQTTPPRPAPNATGEVRVVDPTTGGAKGTKPARFDLIPPGPLWALAELYGKGAQKYAVHNWRKGYAWSLSFAALMRHAWLFWRGEEIDAETGCPHMACAAFHCFSLMEFCTTKRSHDDRHTADAAKGTP